MATVNTLPSDLTEQQIQAKIKYYEEEHLFWKLYQVYMYSGKARNTLEHPSNWFSKEIQESVQRRLKSIGCDVEFVKREAWSSGYAERDVHPEEDYVIVKKRTESKL